MEPLEDFFSKYPPFIYNRSASATSEFKRLSKANQWEQKSGPWRNANEAFQIALIRQFNLSYGTNPSSLPHWHKLLKQMGISQPPRAISECKAILKTTHVNLVDLVDAGGDPTKIVKTFKTEKELSVYTKRTKKIFPKDSAKAGGILECLLRHIFQPGSGPGRRRRRKKKKTAKNL